jgi:2'-5' RNA ligase
LVTTVRTFIAIELDKGLLAGLELVQERLRERVPPRSVRWVRPEAIHLTLKFLGDTPVEQVDAIKAAIVQAAAESQCFDVVAGSVGCFPNARRPRVVWIGLQEPTGALVRLRDRIETRVAPLGFPTEKRPFSPHLTLGRVQRRASKSEVQEIGEVVSASTFGKIGEMAVSNVSHIKSDLLPSGAVYTTLSEARLQQR